MLLGPTAIATAGCLPQQVPLPVMVTHIPPPMLAKAPFLFLNSRPTSSARLAQGSAYSSIQPGALSPTTWPRNSSRLSKTFQDSLPHSRPMAHRLSSSPLNRSNVARAITPARMVHHTLLRRHHNNIPAGP